MAKGHSSFELGVTVQDVITKFKGVAVGMVTYLTGCDQYLVQPPVDKDGKHSESRWIDVTRLTLVKKTKVVLPTPPTAPRSGPDKAAPRR